MSETISAKLAALQSLHEKATPGPWRKGIPGNPNIYGPDNSIHAGPVASALHRIDPQQRADNRDWITEMHNAAPTLIRAVQVAISGPDSPEKREIENILESL
jgi:hypothetical protein